MLSLILLNLVLLAGFAWYVLSKLKTFATNKRVADLEELHLDLQGHVAVMKQEHSTQALHIKQVVADQQAQAREARLQKLAKEKRGIMAGRNKARLQNDQN